jgi:hypothetical protein
LTAGKKNEKIVRFIYALSHQFSFVFSMAPKMSNAGKEKLIGDEDEVLQAVILADSFNKRFKPLTTLKPRVRTTMSYKSRVEF